MVIAIVMKQELFGLALTAQWTFDPFLNGAGDHGAPEFLLCDLLVFVDVN